MPEPITVTADHGGTRRPYTIEVAFRRSAPGRWVVVRAETNRRLGWLIKAGRRWEARVFADAFRGRDAHDEGHVLDAVPWDLTCSDDGVRHHAVGSGATRREATFSLVWHLIRHKAPAVGFGAHPAVRPWQPRPRS